jgi:hypothetical protein
MGASVGSYASILFGSLCDNINHVIIFIPQTKLKSPIYTKYTNVKNIINKHTQYIVYGDTGVTNIHDLHHISHCEHIDCFSNVKIIKRYGSIKNTGRYLLETT